MTRLLWVGILLVALAGPAFGGIPDAGFSDVSFYQAIRGQEAILVCPAADLTPPTSFFDVTVMSQFNRPLEDVEVVCTFANANVTVLDEIRDTTDVNGFCRIPIHAGTIITGPRGTTALSSEYTVTCETVVLKTGTVYVLSPDLDGADIVGPLDFSVFALDWLLTGVIPPPGLRSDYNQDGSVNPLDFSIFALHWLQVFP